jgi:hypothetical protein
MRRRARAFVNTCAEAGTRGIVCEDERCYSSLSSVIGSSRRRLPVA